MSDQNTNGNGAAQAAYLVALEAVGQSVKILQMELAEVDAAAADVRQAGRISLPGYPAALAEGVKRQCQQWALTNEGRALLGLERLPTHNEAVLADARLAAAEAERRLAEVKKIPNVPGVSDERRRLIETAARNLIHCRQRVVDLDPDPSTAEAFRGWVRGFLADVRRALQESATVPGIGESIARRQAEDLREARQADPLGALVADVLAGE